MAPRIHKKLRYLQPCIDISCDKEGNHTHILCTTPVRSGKTGSSKLSKYACATCYLFAPDVLRFDNTYSWVNAKKIFYTVDTLKPSSLDEINAHSFVTSLWWRCGDHFKVITCRTLNLRFYADLFSKWNTQIASEEFVALPRTTHTYVACGVAKTLNEYSVNLNKSKVSFHFQAWIYIV